MEYDPELSEFNEKTSLSLMSVIFGWKFFKGLSENTNVEHCIDNLKLIPP